MLLKSDMTRILIWFWSHGGGGSQFAVNLAGRLRRDFGDDNVALSMKLGDPVAQAALQEGIEVRLADIVSHRGRPLASFWGLKAASAIIADHAADADVVVAAMNFATLAPLSLGLKRPLVYCAHDPVPHPGDYAAIGQRVSQSILLKRADRVVGHSNYAAHILARDPSVAAKLVVAPLQSVFRPVACERRPSVTVKRLLFAGRMIAYKGGALLADCLDLIRKKEGWCLSIVGAGPAMTEALRKRFNHPQIDVFRPEFIEREEFSRYFAASDVVMLPYLEASQSGVVAEALAHSRPCLVTPVGALVEQIGEGEGGWVAGDATPRALADTLAEVLTSDIHPKQIGAARIASSQWTTDCWRWLETVAT